MFRHFTFHSGYIPINRFHHGYNRTISLYIPFWIYSNTAWKTRKTLQKVPLHSILDIFQYTFTFISSTVILLYIPFWIYAYTHHESHLALHSILDIFQSERLHINPLLSLLYIPFWIYSNGASKSPGVMLNLFTFHPCVKYWIHFSSPLYYDTYYLHYFQFTYKKHLKI